MEYGVHPTARVAARHGVADVALLQFHLALDPGQVRLETTGQVVQYPHAGPLGHERPHDVRADEPRSPGHERERPLHATLPSGSHVEAAPSLTREEGAASVRRPNQSRHRRYRLRPTATFA